MSINMYILSGSACAGICYARAVDAGISPLYAGIALACWLTFGLWILKRKPKAKYKLSFWEKYLHSHVTIGPVTLYMENAMHWAINISTSKGYLCFRLPFRCFGRWWPLYCYLSPNATPQDATWWGWGKRKV